MATAVDERVKELLLDMVKMCQALNIADQTDEQIIEIINEGINKLAAPSINAEAPILTNEGTLAEG